MPIRGSSFNNTSNGGVAALNLNNARSNVNSNVSFRSAFPLQPEVTFTSERVPCVWVKGVLFRSKGDWEAGNRRKKIELSGRQLVTLQDRIRILYCKAKVS